MVILGVGGILISVAKLVITTLCAGIHPARTLPVVLDCGTDVSYYFMSMIARPSLISWQNHQLLNDELYLGLRRPRVRGKDYDQFVDTFVQSARKLYPRAYIHLYDTGRDWMCHANSADAKHSEDFGLSNARRILDEYSQQVPCFNDDVQGTGCITLAAILAALHVSGLKLTDMRMIVFGSGSAGTGIADQVRDAIATESGKPEEEAAKQIWYVVVPSLQGPSH